MKDEKIQVDCARVTSEDVECGPYYLLHTNPAIHVFGPPQICVVMLDLMPAQHP